MQKFGLGHGGYRAAYGATLQFLIDYLAWLETGPIPTGSRACRSTIRGRRRRLVRWSVMAPLVRTISNFFKYPTVEARQLVSRYRAMFNMSYE
ncbi:hypothetical protein [Sphingopyxis sp. NJF-3]